MHSLSFTIAPGTVTGFLGPERRRQSTTMRMIMGLDRPTSGTVTSPEAGMLQVSGTTAEHVGEVAFRNGLLLHRLSPRRASLEGAYAPVDSLLE